MTQSDNIFYREPSETDKMYERLNERIASLEAENAMVRAEPRMRWENCADKPLDEDWWMHHLRYSFDHVKVDNDLFELVEGGLKKKGGTGFLPFNLIEWLEENPTEPVFTVDDVYNAYNTGHHADICEPVKYIKQTFNIDL